MSPPRRRSARLASASTPKPKAVSSLSSLAEHDERDETPEKAAPHGFKATITSPDSSPATPASSAIKPPMSEMHPSKAQPTASDSAGTWLGFRDIKSADVSRGKTTANHNSTPSKLGVPSTPFTFSVSRPNIDVGLSANAQRMMDELRVDAARIKADLLARREEEKEEEQITSRKIAKARGKSGRFSAAHMAEFKKMDSIENHPSSFRANAGHLTPNRSSLKRSSSKANLDGTPKSTLKRTHSKADLNETPKQLKPALKRTPSKPNFFERQAVATSSKATMDPSLSPSKLASAYAPESPSPVKRIRKQFEDDASTHRPISRDGSSIPRPKASNSELRPNSHLASLLSPTKASAARAGSGNTPQQSSKLPTTGLTKSSSKGDLKQNTKLPTAGLTKSTSRGDLAAAAKSPVKSFGSLTTTTMTTSTTSSNLASLTRKTTQLKNRVISPGRFDRVKSILKGTRTASGNVQTAIPGPSSGISQTPAPQPTQKTVPTVPFTTPRRRLFKRVDFTPDTKGPTRDDFGEVSYPNLDAVLGRIPKEDTADVTSPTPGTAQRPLPEPPKADEPSSKKAPMVPGAFTFRSEHSIRFGSGSPAPFGSSPGQSSIRHVRPSLPLKELPGSFPSDGGETSQPGKGTTSPGKFDAVPHGRSNEKRARTDVTESHPDKENHAPVAPVFVGMPHGLANEKRARADAASSHSEKDAKSPVKAMPTYAHGLANKKRARANEDDADADQEGADRGGKRRKAEPSSAGRATANTKLARTTPGPGGNLQKSRAGSATPSPVKKRLGMTMSRLNALAQPRRR